MIFLKKSLVNIIGTTLLGLVNLTIGILLARWLLPEGIGRYQLVISAANLIGAVITLGIGQATIFYINNVKKAPDLVATTAFKFAFVASVVVLPILVAVFHYRPYFGEIPFWMMLVCAIQGVGLVFLNTLYPILVAFLQVNKYVLVRLVPRLIVLVLVTAVILLGVVNINFAWISVSVGQLCGAVCVIYFLRRWIKYHISFDWPLFKSMVFYGAKLNLNYIVLILNGEIGILLLRFFAADSFAEVGYYSRAIRLGAILLLFSGSLSPLLYSKWASVDRTQRQLQAERVSRVFWVLLVVLIGVIELLAERLIYCLYGAEFLPAVLIMRILFVGIGARFLLTPFFLVFSSSGHPLLTSIVLSTNLVIMAALMALLVPIYKGVGAAIAFTVGNIAGLVLGYIIGHTRFGIRIQNSLIITADDVKYITNTLLPVRN